MAATKTAVLGTAAFVVFWVLAVFPSCKILPIGRTAGALLAATLMVVFQVLSPHAAYNAIDLSILGLLFGTMVVSAFLERADMFKYLATALSWKSQGAKDLICRVCILSAISSALFTNDTSCVVLTEFVLILCRQKNLHPKPFLVALASSANIGSVATPIGNPQNLVIAVQSGISFGHFLLGLLPCMILGVLVNIVLLLLVYWKQLSQMKDTSVIEGFANTNADMKIESNPCPFTDVVVPIATENPTVEVFPYGHVKHSNDFACDVSMHVEIANSQTCEPPELGKEFMLDTPENCCLEGGIADSRQEVCVLEVEAAQNGQHECIVPVSPVLNQVQGPINIDLYEEDNGPIQNWRRRAWKGVVYAVTGAMLAALLYGFDLSWSTVTAAVTLMALDFQDADPNLVKVSYPLLVFFTGMFITVAGFDATGIPGMFWEIVEPHARIENARGIMVLALVVIALSNIASNVPTVLLLGSRIASSAAVHNASVTKSWLILAWSSTIAGNLTLVGSAANLIVSEQARKAQLLGYELNFWNHLMFGFPSTIITAVVGLYAIRG